MQIFGRDVLSTRDLWDVYSQVTEISDIWRPETFAMSAKCCGLKRIFARRGYFSFSGPSNLKGQAPVTAGYIEEMRLFIGEPTRDLSDDLWEADKSKLTLLASDYSDLFHEKLGLPRKANSNDIFEYNGYRVRVLASNSSVWVVISNLDVISKLPNDWWPRPVRT